MTQLTNRLSATLALALMTAAPALAQSSSAPAALPSYELGGGILAAYYTDLEGRGVEVTQAPSAWITLPVGRLRLQIEYLRDVRSQPLYYAGYGRTDDQGREISYDVAREDYDVGQVLGVVIKWPFPELSRRSYLLIGGAWTRLTARSCVAVSPGDRPEHGARLDFPPGFECSRSPGDVRQIGLPLYGVGVDLPLGSRFFGSVQYRARGLPLLGELRVGAGVRF